MRVLFIPGLGEEGFVFDKIYPKIPGEKLIIENWDELGEVSGDELTVADYARFLIDKFSIKSDDLVIGHSMGGWIGLYIKQFTGCRLIHIATWTDSKKVITIPVPNTLKYWLAKNRLAFLPIAREIIVGLRYRNEPSKEIFIKVFDKLRTGDAEIAAKQLKVIFNPVSPSLTVQPDLRLHSIKDHIVKPPDEFFIQTPGDHFALYTYPESVYNPINDYLKTIENS